MFLSLSLSGNATKALKRAGTIMGYTILRAVVILSSSDSSDRGAMLFIQVAEDTYPHNAG